MNMLNNERGGVGKFLLVVLILVIGVVGFRFITLKPASDSSVVASIQARLTAEMMKGELPGLKESLEGADLGGIAGKIKSMLTKKVELVSVQESRPILPIFSAPGKVLYRVVFSVKDSQSEVFKGERYYYFEQSPAGSYSFRHHVGPGDFFLNIL